MVDKNKGMAGIVFSPVWATNFCKRGISSLLIGLSWWGTTQNIPHILKRVILSPHFSAKIWAAAKINQKSAFFSWSRINHSWQILRLTRRYEISLPTINCILSVIFLSLLIPELSWMQSHKISSKAGYIYVLTNVHLFSDKTRSSARGRNVTIPKSCVAMFSFRSMIKMNPGNVSIFKFGSRKVFEKVF